VPVGQDQLPHLELSREVVRRFNHLYGPVFPEMEAIISEAPLLIGPDGRKMSKSYGNAITLASTDEEIDALVMGMVTDPQRIRKDDPGNPEICNVYAWHQLFGRLGRRYRRSSPGAPLPLSGVWPTSGRSPSG
jgi:tryptophanyl-tRNA synthetase